MNRITENLADLVNDGSDSDLDDDNTATSSVNNKKKKKVNNNTSSSSSSRLGGTGQHIRQIIVVVSLVAIIIGASLAIGYTVVNNNGTSSQSSYLMANNEKEDKQEQTLLEIAERVITACSEDKLNEDMKECQNLCHSRMCCFEESGSDYSCQLDTSKNCAVYAGCEALVEGILVGGAEEDEA